MIKECDVCKGKYFLDKGFKNHNHRFQCVRCGGVYYDDDLEEAEI